MTLSNGLGYGAFPQNRAGCSGESYWGGIMCGIRYKKVHCIIQWSVFLLSKIS